jgi:hypothetical protein
MNDNKYALPPRFGCAFFFVAILLCIGGYVATHDPRVPMNSSSSEAAEASPSNLIEHVIQEKFYDMKPIDIKINDSNIQVRMRFDPSYGSQHDYRTFLTDSAGFFEVVYQDSKFSKFDEIDIFASDNLVDEYGQESVYPVAKLIMNRRFALKCNFTNLKDSPLRFYRLLDRPDSDPEKIGCWFFYSLRRVLKRDEEKDAIE